MTIPGTMSEWDPRRIGVAADHGGFEVKHYLTAGLREVGQPVSDFGDHPSHSDDNYPDFIIPLAKVAALEHAITREAS